MLLAMQDIVARLNTDSCVEVLQHVFNQQPDNTEYSYANQIIL